MPISKLKCGFLPVTRTELGVSRQLTRDKGERDANSKFIARLYRHREKRVKRLTKT